MEKAPGSHRNGSVAMELLLKSMRDTLKCAQFLDTIGSCNFTVKVEPFPSVLMT